MAQAIVESLVEEALRYKKRAQELGAFLKTQKAQRFIDGIYSLRCETIEVYIYISNANLYFSVYVKNLDGFKDSRLEGILNQMEYNNPESTSMTEDAGSMSKTFNYSFSMLTDTDAPVFAVNITAQIKSDSKTCHQEIIGMTQAESRPIYKLVCDEQINPVVEE